MKKLLFAAILGSMAMASCSNEDTVAPGAPVNGRFKVKPAH